MTASPHLDAGRVVGGRPHQRALLSADEFAAWLRLLETPGLGRDGARRLLAAVGSPEAVFGAAPAQLRSLIGPALAAALAALPPDFERRLAAADAWRTGTGAGADGGERHVVTVGDAAYPPLLLQTADPPLLLYVQGRLDLLAADSIAVVGSRNPSAQGSDNARAFGRQLCADGWTVVSGLALGVDGAAHEGALGIAESTAAAAGASTVAVVGTGLDRVYPAAHRQLARRIAATGAVVSEFAPGTPALPPHFPLRNRIIAGLSLGTLVVEAALKSGSLITARLASEAGREVFAVPGSIHAPQSRGCHALIRQGAKLVETAGDIFEELRGRTQPPRQGGQQRQLPTAPAASAALPTGAAALFEALGNDPVTLDALLARTGRPAGELNVALFELELQGHVARLPGGLFQRRHSG